MTTPPVLFDLSSKDLNVLERRDEGELQLQHVQKYAQGIADAAARRAFLTEWLRREDQWFAGQQAEQVVKVREGIQEIEAQLKWPDDKLKELVPGKTPVEIREILKAKLGAEEMRYRANQNMMRVMEMELKEIRRKFAADLK